MRELLYHYEMTPATWVYLSSLLIIGIFFKFRRFWSVRNLDLAALIALSPGLLMVLPEKPGLDPINEPMGYGWLFAVGAFFLFRLLVDPAMVRRPLLEPNLTTDGLTFTGVAILIFLMANLIKAPPDESDLVGAQRWEEMLARREVPPADLAAHQMPQHGPGYPLFYMFSSLPNRALLAADRSNLDDHRRYNRQEAAAKTTAILAHLALVIGLVLIGYRHFDNFQTGVGAATLYLLLPYAALMTGHVEHAVPAALLVWAVEAYRRPLLAGIFMGAAIGAVLHPLFLLPLWCSFYWQRGLVRFVIGVVGMLLVMIGTLTFTSGSLHTFVEQLKLMFGMSSLFFDPSAAKGFWEFHEQAYRWPVLAAFVALSGSFILWPAQKNLGTLLSCSAAVMLGTQFWRTQYGGLYIAWYMPLLILTVLRPNLEDRVATSALSEGWIRWRKARAPE